MPYRYRGTGVVIETFKGNALFYKLKTKLPLDVITKLFTAEKEAKTEIPTHLETESHWLADWGFSSADVFDSFQDGCEMEVQFEIKSTSYNPNMKHGNVFIGPCRNLNLVKVSRL